MTGTSASRRTVHSHGYLGSIVINAFLLYAVGHLVDWQIGWITPAWSDVVWALSLSLEVSIAANALFLVYHDWLLAAGGVQPGCAASGVHAVRGVPV